MCFAHAVIIVIATMTHMKYLLYLSLLGIVLSSCQSDEEKVHQIISDITNNTEFNGVAYVEYNGEIIFNQQINSIPEQLEAPSSNSKLHLASLSKLFTELTIIRLTEEGLIELDSTIDTYLKIFRPSFGNKITVRQLLKMKSGLPRELNETDLTKGVELNNEGFAGPFLDSIPDFELEFTPGSTESYSNLNYWLLGSIIESVTGKNMEDALTDYLFTPLDMENSGWEKTSTTSIPAYIKNGDGWHIDSTKYGPRYASGGFYSSLNDLLKLVKAIRSKDFLTPKGHAILFDKVQQKVEVYGALPAYTNMFICDLENDFTMIVLNNIGISNLEAMSSLKNQVAAVFNINYASGHAKNTVVLNSLNNLSDTVRLEYGMKQWITAIASENETEIFEVFNRFSTEQEDRNDPTWAEIVKAKKTLPNFRPAGFRWITDEKPGGLEVWYICDTGEKVAFLWIPDKNEPDKISTLMISPDDMEWMGQQF